MTATMANMVAALKEDIQPGLAEQLNTSYILLSQIAMNTKDVEGRHAIIKAHVGRNTGVGARAAGATLPTAGRQKYVESKVAVIRNYGSISIEGDLIEASASDRGSVVRHLAAETEGVIEDLKFEVNRQVYNESWQNIAKCGITTASTTVVVEALSRAALRHLFVGQGIDIGTEADPDSIAAGRSITAIGTTTITIDGAAVTTTASHAVTLANAGGVELTGLRHIISATGALQELNPATAGQESWASGETAVGGNADESVFEVAIENVETASGKTPNLLVSTKGVRRNFKDQLQAQRSDVDTMDVKGGFTAVSVTAGNATLPFIVDDDCPNGEAYLINTSTLIQYQMGPAWTFMEQSGSPILVTANVDAYEARLKNYHQLGTTNRNSHAVLTGITETY